MTGSGFWHCKSHSGCTRAWPHCRAAAVTAACHVFTSALPVLPPALPRLWGILRWPSLSFQENKPTGFFPTHVLSVTFPMFYLFPISHAGFALQVHPHSLPITIPRTNQYFTSHPLLFTFSSFLSSSYLLCSLQLAFTPLQTRKMSRANT